MRSEARKAAIRKADAEVMAHMRSWYPFQHRPLGKRTVEALIDHGIDAPERLLFMTESELQAIPGVGRVSRAEIKAYRERFLP